LGKTRKWTDSAPVGGLPRVFLVRDIDLVINFMYQKSKPGERVQSPAPALTRAKKYDNPNDPG
jgi:hypothetical protein